PLDASAEFLVAVGSRSGPGRRRPAGATRPVRTLARLVAVPFEAGRGAAREGPLAPALTPAVDQGRCRASRLRQRSELHARIPAMDRANARRLSDSPRD